MNSHDRGKKPGLADTPKERALRSEVAQYRRKGVQLRMVLREYQKSELQDRLAKVMPWDLFERLIGLENVLGGDERIDFDELIARVNAEHARMPGIVPRRLSRADFDAVAG